MCGNGLLSSGLPTFSACVMDSGCSSFLAGSGLKESVEASCCWVFASFGLAFRDSKQGKSGVGRQFDYGGVLGHEVVVLRLHFAQEYWVSSAALATVAHFGVFGGLFVQACPVAIVAAAVVEKVFVSIAKVVAVIEREFAVYSFEQDCSEMGFAAAFDSFSVVVAAVVAAVAVFQMPVAVESVVPVAVGLSVAVEHAVAQVAVTVVYCSEAQACRSQKRTRRPSNYCCQLASKQPFIFICQLTMSTQFLPFRQRSAFSQQPGSILSNIYRKSYLQEYLTS